MFYEQKHRMDPDYFLVEQGENFSFSLHLHRCFEIILVTSGEMRVQIDEHQYRLAQGDAVLIFPNQVHGLKTEQSSRHILCIFAPEIINYYYQKVKYSIPKDNLIHLQKSGILPMLCSLSNFDDLCKVKGIFYLIGGQYFGDTALLPRSTGKHGRIALLSQIFSFINQYYDEDCLLKKLAQEISYDYAYLSKFFKSNVEISFNEYVNQYRITQACYLMKNTDKSMLEISGECGFQSLRSFNRNFIKYKFCTPTEFKKQ